MNLPKFVFFVYLLFLCNFIYATDEKEEAGPSGGAGDSDTVEREQNGQSNENDGNNPPPTWKGMFHKLARISSEESQQLVENILHGGPLFKIKFFEKVVDGTQEERQEIAQNMREKDEKKKNEFIEKEAERNLEEIEKIEAEIRKGLLPKYVDYVEKIVDENLDKLEREKLIAWHFTWNNDVLGEEGKNKNIEAMKNLEFKLEKYEKGGKNEEDKKELVDLLLGHALGLIVEKYEGGTSKIAKRVIEWFVSGKGRMESANIVEDLNGNAETRKKHLVEFFTSRMRSELVGEMEKRANEIFSPEKMSWKKAVEISNYERYFGHNAGNLRKQEISQLVDNIVDGNVYQKIRMFSMIVNDCANCEEERKKIGKQLTGKKEFVYDQFKLVKEAGERTKEERNKLDKQIRMEILEMKEYFLWKFIQKILLPDEEDESERNEGGEDDLEDGTKKEKNEESDSEEEIEQFLEMGEKEMEAEKKEEIKKKKVIYYKFMRMHYKTYERRHPGLNPYRRGHNQSEWVEKARKFSEELESFIDELKAEIGNKNVEQRKGEKENNEKRENSLWEILEENETNVDGEIGHKYGQDALERVGKLIEKKLKTMAPAIITKADVEYARNKFIESTMGFRRDLAKNFIEWLQRNEFDENKLIEGTKEERKQFLCQFVATIKKRDLLARIMAKTAYGLRVDHEYLEKLITKGQYLLPPDMIGYVVRHEGMLRSSNPGIDKLLQYVELKARRDLDKAEKKAAERKAQNIKVKGEKEEQGTMEIDQENEEKENDAEREEANQNEIEEKEIVEKQKLLDNLNKLAIPTLEQRGCFLRLRITSRMRHYAFLFDEAVTIPQGEIEQFLERYDDGEKRILERGADVTAEELEEFMEKITIKRKKKEETNIYKKEEEDDEGEDERYTQITTHVLVEIIKKGTKALGENRELNWEKMEKLENKVRPKKWYKKIVEFFKYIFDKFIMAKKFIQHYFEKIKTPLGKKEMKKLGEYVGNEMREATKKDAKSGENAKKNDKMENDLKKEKFKNAEKKLKKMQNSRFMWNHDPHARLIRQKADTFEFLRQVRFEFEASPGEDKDSQKLAEMIRKEEKQAENNAQGQTGRKKTIIKRLKNILPNRRKQQQMPATLSEEDKTKYNVCEELRETIEAVMYPRISSAKEEQEDPVHYELRGRLGASILLSIMNTKSLTRELFVGLCLSLLGSGFVALFIDVGVILLISTFFHWTAGFALSLIVPFSIVIRSITPLLAESFDSFIIKRLMGLNRGMPFWPQTRKEMESNVRDALLAGTISAVGSIPFNIVSSISFFANWAWMPVKAVSNFIGTSTSAAMVPMEVEKMGGHTGASILIKIQQKYLAEPNQEKIMETYEQRRQELVSKWKMLRKPNEDDENDAWKSLHTEALQSYIRSKTRRTMRIAKASALAMSSLGVGATISFLFGFLMFAVPVQLGWIPETEGNERLVEVFSILFNTPTEIISFTTQSVTGEYLGLSDEEKLIRSREDHFPRKWLSRDSTKNRQMMQLVFNKTIKQFGDENKESKDLVRIKYKELHDIFRPLLAYTSPFGEWISNLLRRIFISFGLIKNLLKNTDVSNLRDRARNNVETSGLIDEAETIVENWQENMVYVIQRPRTSTAPSLAPSDLKLETWLKFRKIPFYRLTNARFLTALFNEQLPIAEFRGEQIVGSVDEIIRELEIRIKEPKVELGDDPNGVLDFIAVELEDKEKAKKLRKKERAMRKLVDKVLNRIFTYDRQYAKKKNLSFSVKKTIKIKNKILKNQNEPKPVDQDWRQKNGAKVLGFVLNDEGIKKQLGKEYGKKPNANLVQSKIDLDGAVDMMHFRLQIYKLEPDDDKFIKMLRKKKEDAKKREEEAKIKENDKKEKIKNKKEEEKNGENEDQILTYQMLDADELFELAKRTMDKIGDQLMETEEELKGQSYSAQSEISEESRFYLFGQLPTQADASLFAHLALFQNLNIPKMREYFEGMLDDPTNIFSRYIGQIKKDQWSKKGEQNTAWDELMGEPWGKLNYDYENEWADEKIEKTESFYETNAPFGLLPNDIEPAELEMEKETPRELAQIEVEKDEEKKKHWWNVETWPNVFKGNKKVEGVEGGEKSKMEAKPFLADQNDRIRLERFWARELIKFDHLPLPESDMPNIDFTNDSRFEYYSPMLKDILIKLFQIGKGKYTPKAADEEHSKMLKRNVDGLIEYFRKKGVDPSNRIIRTLLRLMAVYLCKNLNEKDKCEERHLNEAENEFKDLQGYFFDMKDQIYKPLKIFLWNEIFIANEESVNKQLKVLGKSLVRNVKSTNEKVKKWLHPSKIFAFIKKIAILGREWVVEKVVNLLAASDNVAIKYAEADEREEKKEAKKAAKAAKTQQKPKEGDRKDHKKEEKIGIWE